LSRGNIRRSGDGILQDNNNRINKLLFIRSVTVITVKKEIIMKKLMIVFAVMLLAGAGCKKSGERSPVLSSYDIVFKNMLISNNLSSLNKRIVLVDNSPVYYFGNAARGTMKSNKGTDTSSVTIQLIARLIPPDYNGEILQASHVQVADHYAFVAYNTQGTRYLGGTDVVDVSNPADPEIISSVLFINPETNKGKDVSSIDVELFPSAKSNTIIWITGSDETRDSAFVERYELNSSNQFESDNSLNFSLPGFVGTDVRFYNDKVYVTSGSGGGLTILDNQMKKVSFLNLENARSVDVNTDFEIALGGNPGHLYNPGIWDKEIGGATDPGAKSIIRLYNKFALVALGEEGLKCYDISTSAPTLVSSLPRPAVPEGAEPWDYVTNGVSVSANGWVYIANGAAGLDVAKIDDNGQLTWMGNINLESSVNFVEANGSYVFAARGVLGLKILKVTEK
jgi:hypothetical protein